MKKTAKEEENNAHKCAHEIKLENCASTPIVEKATKKIISLRQTANYSDLL